MNKVFKSAILFLVVSAFIGCSDLASPVSDTSGSTSGTNTTDCEDCRGNSQLLAIVPVTTSYDIYPNQIVQTISGNCNDGQFPNSYITWEMVDDDAPGVVVKASTTAVVYTGKTIFANGQSIEGVYFCRQGKFIMDVEMPGVTTISGPGGIGGRSHTVRVLIHGLDENNKSYPASISRNYRLIPKS